ncbi:MAG: hypothetical protein AB1609_18110 [Bacillota bacterium]
MLQLVAKACERRSLVVTSNLEFQEWGALFDSPATAAQAASLRAGGRGEEGDSDHRRSLPGQTRGLFMARVLLLTMSNF